MDKNSTKWMKSKLFIKKEVQRKLIICQWAFIINTSLGWQDITWESMEKDEVKILLKTNIAINNKQKYRDMMIQESEIVIKELIKTLDNQYLRYFKSE